MGKNQQVSKKGVPRALSIAGSDSGGCAGIQADLKTFGALEVHGMSVVTSITAQDTKRVHQALTVSSDLVAKQTDAVLSDIGVDSVKTGMLPTSEIICVVVEKMLQFQVSQLVVDPVMIATSGDRLIDEEAVGSLKEKLFPIATLITPNLYETQALVRRTLGGGLDLREAAKRLISYGPKAILIKGGHSDDPEVATDLFYDGKDFLEISAPRVQTNNTHGGGCTLSAAITAFLARGFALEESVRQAKEYVTEALQHSFDLGAGNGPLCHFYSSWHRCN